jgi:hypothetical protein
MAGFLFRVAADRRNDVVSRFGTLSIAEARLRKMMLDVIADEFVHQSTDGTPNACDLMQDRVAGSVI